MKRILLLFLVIFASGCTEALVAPKIDSSAPAEFEELWNDFNLRYATFPERHVNWDSLHALYTPRITPNMPDSTLLQYCDSLLAPLRDAHVSISDANTFYGFTQTDSTYPFNFDRVSSYYLGETANQSSDGTILYGRINDSIGYMNVTTFDLTDDDYWGTEIDAILDSLQNTKFLIIDLRANGGGKGEAGLVLEARFMLSAQTFGYIQARYDATYTDLSAPEPVSTSISHARWTKPIVLLTNRETVSEAEWFTMAMRKIPNVTVIGDTTQGAFSSRLDGELSNGWLYSMSEWKVSDANHICHEGIGLIPDIEIYVKENQRVYSPDTVLDRAIQFLTK